MTQIREQETSKDLGGGTENLSSPVVLRNPIDLLDFNPQTAIINPASYRQLLHFAPEQFDPVQLAHVITYDEYGNEVVREGIHDGVNRTRSYADRVLGKLPPIEDHDFTQMPCRFVTQSLINNPDVVLPDEKTPNQKALTMVQYLRAVIEPTRKHGDIAKHRIAAHLINGWTSMVGKEIASQYSASAALLFLSSRGDVVMTHDKLVKFLNEQSELIGGETIDKRKKLKEGLVNMGTIIRDMLAVGSEITSPKQIANAAFEIISGDVSGNSEAIGGREAAQQQVIGLLAVPGVERKLIVESGNNEVAAAKLADDTARKLVDVLSNLPPYRKDKEAVFTIIQEGLIDSEFPLKQLLSVLEADNPEKEYSNRRKQLNLAILRSIFYESLGEDRSLTTDEETMLINLGSKPYIPSEARQGIAVIIQRTTAEIATARSSAPVLLDTIATTPIYGNPVKKAELQALLDESLTNILSAQTTADCTNRLSRLQHVMRTIRDEVQYRNTLRGLDTAVRQNFVGLLNTMEEPDAFAQTIVRHLAGMRDVILLTDTTMVNNYLMQLKTLDPDLREQVVNGSMRMQYALNQQRQKSGRVLEEPVRRESTEGSDIYRGDRSPSTPVRRQRPITPPIIEKTTPPTPATDETALFRSQEQARIEHGNRILTGLLTAAYDSLQVIDLGNSEVGDFNRTLLENVLTRLGMLRFGDKVDVTRIVKEYPELLHQLKKAREALVARDQDDLTNLTKTGQ